MCRTLLLPLVVGGLALGLPFVRGHRPEHGGRAAAFVSARSETGVLALPEAEARFTLYWPETETRGTRPLIIFAADARAQAPRPLRLFAQAAATAGVASVYLEPTRAPADAAARLKGVLQRQAVFFDIDEDGVVTWVEGEGFQGPAAPCRQTRLAAAVGGLERAFEEKASLFRWALGQTLSAACLVRGNL